MTDPLVTLFLLLLNVIGLVFTIRVSLYKHRRGLEITTLDTLAFYINVAAVIALFAALVIEVFS